MSHLGKLSEFHPRTQNFDSYLERFELFIIANDVIQEKVLPVFLTAIGAEAYEVLRSLVVPDAPANKTFAEGKQLLQAHYRPSSLVIAERGKFNRRVQHEQESVEDFIVELKHLARKCDFGEFLNDALRDRLVAGVRNEDTQRALFAEENLKFDNACKIALGRELAARGSALMKATDGNINSLKSRQRENREGCDATSQPSESRPKIQCERCGKNHSASKCWYKEFSCRRCDKLGHLQKMCRNEPRRSKRTNAVESSEDEREEEVYHFVNMTHSSYEVSVVVDGRPLNAD
ncbi:uncharacterized protein LOC144169516 [Haemaphysalis longicornis]